jgi:hypothetical protein
MLPNADDAAQAAVMPLKRDSTAHDSNHTDDQMDIDDENFDKLLLSFFNDEEELLVC